MPTTAAPTQPQQTPAESTGATPLRVALIGNPNTGKSSLFNALTGYRRHVANYPGVTVDAARGPVRAVQRPIELLDLPGTYSLAALSPDELLVSNVLHGRMPGAARPDAILAICDASNLPRNLYLVSQLLEIGLPVVIALNMMDEAEARGYRIDAEELTRRLGVPVVPVIATNPKTVEPLRTVLEQVRVGDAPVVDVELPEALVWEAEQLAGNAPQPLTRLEAARILNDHESFAEQQYLAQGGDAEALRAARARLHDAGAGLPAEVRSRYAWVARKLDGALRRPETPVETWSDRLDRLLTHRLWGALILAGVLFLLFQSIFTTAAPLMEAIEAGVGALGGWVGELIPAGTLRSLVVDGAIAGVGSVLVFLPQILILFAFIAVLEDCGYMARAAYMMDRVMKGVGLSGRAFIPLLSSFACAVPAIMGTRAIADRRERYLTIMLAPFMSCSARLPVYILLIAAFVPAGGILGGWIGVQGLTMFAMYLVGVVAAIPVALVLRRTALRGPRPGFLLELPSYKVPRLRAVLQRMYFAGRGFLVRAGTVIFAVNVVVWALAYFPRDPAVAQQVRQEAAAQQWDDATYEQALEAAYLRDSYLGHAGHAIEPLIKPIGWDWRIGVGVVASFPAREVIVATMGTLFSLGGDVDETSEPLRTRLAEARWPDGSALFTLPVALSLMVFFALCAQCASTLVVIGRETRSWGWPIASFMMMTVMAYFAAWGTAAGAAALGL